MQPDVMWSPEAWARAWYFAAQAHQGQAEPAFGLPYLVHLGMVAMEVSLALRQEPGRREDLAMQCALLHDTVEDTGVTWEALRREFGQEVADGVAALSKREALPAPARMEDSLRRIRAQPQEVWMVKLADRVTNLRPPPPHWSRARAQAYLEEARRIHEALGAASPWLSARLLERAQAYERHLLAMPEEAEGEG